MLPLLNTGLNFFSYANLASKAENQCLQGTWYQSRLCRLMGVSYPPYPSNNEEMAACRQELLDEKRIAWVQLGGPAWHRLWAIGTVHRYTKLGIAFEASRIEPAAGAAPDFEMLHVCRTKPCTFKGGTRSANTKGLPVHHVTAFAFTDGLDVPGNAPALDVVNTAVTGPSNLFKYVIFLIIVGLGLLTKVKTALSEIDVKGVVSSTTKGLSSFFFDNLFTVLFSTEIGLVGGFCESLWQEHPPWFPGLARAFLYGYLGHKFNVWNYVFRRLFPNELPTWCNWVKKPQAGTGEKRRASRASSGTEPPSDSDDNTCQGGIVYMRIHGLVRPLSDQPCREPSHRAATLSLEDIATSHLPEYDTINGVPLCRVHGDAYHTLRGHTICVTKDCSRLGTLGPTGAFNCPLHLAASLTPAPPVPQVSFQDACQKDSVKEGIAGFPDAVIAALIKNVDPAGIMEQPELVDELTREYGGQVLDNAKRVRDVVAGIRANRWQQPWDVKHDPRLDQSNEAPEVPRRDPRPYPGPALGEGNHAGSGPVRWAASPSRQRAYQFDDEPMVSDGDANDDIGNSVSGYPARTHAATPPGPGQGPAGLGRILSHTPLEPPIQTGAQTQDALLSSMVYHIDRLANPDVTAKPGTLEGVKRMEEILVFVARFFDNHHVALCPGVVGKNLAQGLKSLNDSLRPLYVNFHIPTGFTNRLCLGAAAFQWGGRDKEDDHVLGEQDFPTWTPYDLDNYSGGSGWALETRHRPSTHIETWRVQARNMAQQFAAIYGSELLDERWDAIEELRQMHVEQPHKFPLSFIRHAWGTLNHRWCQEIRELTNVLRLHAGAERPTFDQLRAVGMTIRESTGQTIYQRPHTFDLKRPDGYFATEIMRKLLQEKEVTDWKLHHSGPRGRAPGPGAERSAGSGETPTKGLPGPPLTAAERRIAGTSAPSNAQGKKICWNFNSHLGCSNNSCERAHEYYKNPDQLTPALRLVLIKRGGFKKRPRITDDKVSDRIQEVRTQAQAEKREKMRNPDDGPGQRAAGATSAPPCYAELDYVDQEVDLRKAVNGPNHMWAEKLPQEETNRPTEKGEAPLECDEQSYVDTVKHLKRLESMEELRFLRDCSPYLSSFVTARVLQDLRNGDTDTCRSIETALQAAADEGLPSLQLDAQQVLETQRRTGRLAERPETHNEVTFGCPSDCGDYVQTPVKVAHTSWTLLDFGDSIPTLQGDPITDVYDPGPKDQNKCMLIHVAAGILWAPTANHQRPDNRLDVQHIMRLARDIRYRQYLQVQQCLQELGPRSDTEPLVIAELRAHAHDLSHAHHDRDHRSIICFPPDELDMLNLGIIRVRPSGRYTVHHIESKYESGRWAYLFSYRGHMRLAIPVGTVDSELVRKRPNSVSRPVGWGYLTQLGGSEVSINTKLLQRCPHCGSQSTRLPPGVEGIMVGKSLLMTDLELRSFSIKSPWNAKAASDYGPEAREAWRLESGSPPLDSPPGIDEDTQRLLERVLELIPGENSVFSYQTWQDVAGATDTFLLSAGSLEVGAHAYTCQWRATRKPTTLTPEGLQVFRDRVDENLYAYAEGLATYGVKPLADSPPTRFRQKPYATVADSPERTAGDLWEDLVKGRLMVFTVRAEPITGDLMESRLAYVSQKDVTNPDSVKVRYISDPRLEINSRIDTERHPRCIVPKHQNVARRVLYWQRRYPGIDILLCKRDVKGAFKLLPVAIAGLTHMGCRFASYIVTYLAMFFGWKPSPANWGVITSMLLQYVATFQPTDEHTCGPESFSPYQYVDDSAFVEPWLGTRPWLAVALWEAGLTRCFGEPALHRVKKLVEGACATRITLWGIDVDTKTGTFTLPECKVERAREFLASPTFDPGNTRIELKRLQELRGKLEHWALCNTAVRPEMAVVDRLLAKYENVACPKGEPREMKQAYLEFWESIECLRINLSTPEVPGVAYTAPFHSVLALDELLSFDSVLSSVVWLGSDATPTTCASVDHTHMTYTVFRYEVCVDYLESITGLERSHFILIALAEYMSVICFLLVMGPRYRGRQVIHVGDNQNVRTWITNRAPKNRIARYLTRLLNRMESEYGFAVNPVFVSSLNNTVCDDLSRLQEGEAHAYARKLGLTYVDTVSTLRWYLDERMRSLSLVLPSDSSERVRAIMQQVEKRVVRSVPRPGLVDLTTVCLGQGVGVWPQVCKTSPLPLDRVSYLPWPSEPGCIHDWPVAHGRAPGTYVMLFTAPHQTRDLTYLQLCMKACRPDIVVYDSHPALKGKGKPTLPSDMTSWSWLVNASHLGAPTSCIRRMTAAVGAGMDFPPGLAPTYLFDMCLPSDIGDYLFPARDEDCLQGLVTLNQIDSRDVGEPTQVGWLACDTTRFGLGLRVTSAKHGKGVIADNATSNDAWLVSFQDSELWCRPDEIKPEPTRYQIFSTKGVAFPFGPAYAPAGYGHTLILDQTTNRARRLSIPECWGMMGGRTCDLEGLDTKVIVTALLNSSPYPVCLYACQLACGIAIAATPADRTGSSPSVFTASDHLLRRGPTSYFAAKHANLGFSTTQVSRTIITKDRHLSPAQPSQTPFSHAINEYPLTRDGCLKPSVHTRTALATYTRGFGVFQRCKVQILSSHITPPCLEGRYGNKLLGMPANKDDRLADLSRELTRLLRHGHNRRRREASLNIDTSDGSVWVPDMLSHPTITAYAASEEDLRIICHDFTNADKIRLVLFHDTDRQGTRIRALNGHTFKIGTKGLPPPILKPRYFLHGTTVENAKLILSTGLRTMKRNDIHLVDYRYTQRQSAYLFHATRKAVWLTIDGEAAAHAGIKFVRLPNGVVLTRGTNGVLPPCLVVAAWLPNRNGATQLDLSALKADPPVTRTIYDIPPYGAPGLECDALPSTGADLSTVLSRTDVEPKSAMSPVIAPQETPSGLMIPQIPEQNTNVTLSQDKNWRPRSPSPQALNSDEFDRPPSWQEELLPSSPSPPKRSRSPERQAPKQKAKLTPNPDVREGAAVLTTGKAPAGAAPGIHASTPKKPPPPPPYLVRRIPPPPQVSNDTVLHPIVPSKPKALQFAPGFKLREEDPSKPHMPEYQQMVNTAVARALSARNAPGSASDMPASDTISFFNSPLRIPPPPLPAQPTVLQCLHAARHFDESWYPRSLPPQTSPEVIQNESTAARAKRLKTEKYRVQRASTPQDQQREEFFTALLKKAENAIKRGDVRKKGGGYKHVLNDIKLRWVAKLFILIIIICNTTGANAQMEFHFPYGPVLGATPRTIASNPRPIGQLRRRATPDHTWLNGRVRPGGHFNHYSRGGAGMHWDTRQGVAANVKGGEGREWRSNKRKRSSQVRWARWALLGLLVHWIEGRTKANENRRGRTPNRFPPSRVGGGPTRARLLRKAALGEGSKLGTPVALSAWAGWCGGGAKTHQTKTIDTLMGQSVADSTKKLYTGAFQKWESYRRIQEKGAYLSTEPADARSEEDSVLAFAALHLGPLERDHATVQNYMTAISHFHKLHDGFNPLLGMKRVQLLLKGAKRVKGPTNRKLPVTVEDLKVVYELLGVDGNIDNRILWCSILLGWHFMLRMSEYVVTGKETQERHPLHMGDIEPLCDGVRCEWGPHVNGVSIFISGSKTDWLNQGATRSHSKVEPGSPNSHLCVVTALLGLFDAYPAKFRKARDAPFTTWRSGEAIPASNITAILRAAAFKQGQKSEAYSLHSLRAGGATALYRATRDIELVARFGRWRTASISSYLWESDQAMSGLSDMMIKGGHTLHLSTKGLEAHTVTRLMGP